MRADEFLNIVSRGSSSDGIRIRYGRIDPNYTSGKPQVIFDSDINPDGPSTPSTKTYPYLESYTPAANDRVMIIDKVIIGKIVT